jgi:hypothetical protein
VGCSGCLDSNPTVEKIGEGIELTSEEILRRGLPGGHRRQLLQWFPARGKLGRGAGIHGKVYGGVGVVGCVLQRRGEAAGGCTASVCFSALISYGTERVEGVRRRAREKKERGDQREGRGVLNRAGTGDELR